MQDEQQQDTVGSSANQAAIDDILEFLPSENEVSIDLPSKGKFYKSCPSGNVKIRPMTFADEKALINSKKANQDPINLLLERCVEGINIMELFQPDKLFLILKLREISYGESYPAVITCNDCSHDNHITFNLSMLPVKEISDDITDPAEFELPVLKKNIKIKIPRVKDEKLFTKADTGTDHLWRFIEEIAGYSDKTVLAKIVDKLPLKDIHKIIKSMDPDFGIETKVKYECQNCGVYSTLVLPITPDFFSTN